MTAKDISELIITVVEPSITQGKIVVNRLNQLGAVTIQYYPTGQLALDFIAKFSPDLVISTMYLPDMTATDLVLKMRGEESMEHIPFMLITSENSIDVLDPIKQAGTVAVLSKPFNLKDLENALYATADLLSIDEEFMETFDWEDLDVLVVDDSPLAQKMVCKLLANIGINKIDYANNGKEGVKAIDNNFYDLVITDYNMPEMDGKALVTYIRKSSDQQSIPVLMITSEQDEARLTAVSNAGVSGVCDKPFEPQVFKELIASFFIPKN